MEHAGAEERSWAFGLGFGVTTWNYSSRRMEELVRGVRGAGFLYDLVRMRNKQVQGRIWVL